VAVDRCRHTAERRCRRSRMELAPSTASPGSAKLEGSGTATCSGVRTTLSLLSAKRNPEIAIFAFKVMSSSEMLLPANTDATPWSNYRISDWKLLYWQVYYRSIPTHDPPRNPSTLRACDPVPDESKAEKSSALKLKSPLVAETIFSTPPPEIVPSMSFPGLPTSAGLKCRAR
jgi:hypothetical protein